jgi:hypothetical protein
MEVLRYARKSSESLDALDALDAINAPTVDPKIAQMPHSVHMQTRLDFAAMFMANRDAKVQPEMLVELWTCLVEKPPVEDDRGRALTWFAHTLTNTKAVAFAPKPGSAELVPQSLLYGANYMFERVMCDQKHVPRDLVTPDMWDCVQQFFTFVNWNVKNVLFMGRGESFAIRRLADMCGVEALWDMLVSARNESVVAKARKFFVALHLRTDWQLKLAERKQPVFELVNRCINLLNKSPNKSPNQSPNDANLSFHRPLQILLSTLVRSTRGDFVRLPKFRVKQVLVPPPLFVVDFFLFVLCFVCRPVERIGSLCETRRIQWKLPR